MSAVRERRLRADHDSVRRAFADHPYITIVSTEGEPPERYKLEFKLRGLVVQNGDVVVKDRHLVEVYLTLGYPRQAPQCRTLTPIFHPNIAPHAVCIGDHWSAGESLAALIARIGELITYQSYNTKSPLNGEAARWADEHLDRLPLQRLDLSVDLSRPASADGQVRPAPPAPGTVTAPPPAPPAPVVSARDLRGHLAAAADAAMHGQLPRALAHLDQAVAQAPGEPEPLRQRGVVRSRLGDRAGAAQDFSAVLRLQPAHPRAEFMLRFVREVQGGGAPPA